MAKRPVLYKERKGKCLASRYLEHHLDYGKVDIYTDISIQIILRRKKANLKNSLSLNY